MGKRRTADPGQLGKRLDTLPGLGELRRAAEGADVYLVGGVVRDLLIGLQRTDIDVVVEGDVRDLARKLGGELTDHERFATAKVRVGELEVDVARARAETYPQPGALPEVRPASLADDLGRRDFTINAMAVPLGGEPVLIDPHGGLGDLREGILRVLHEGSFRDDPTRALRAARYAARLDLEVEPKTAHLLTQTDLSTVSADRRDAELRRIAQEPGAAKALITASGWGLLELPAGFAGLAAGVEDALRTPEWEGVAERADALLSAAGLGAGGRMTRQAAANLARTRPVRPSQGERLTRGRTGVELVVARAMDAEWLDRYVSEWRHVRLEIDGRDLLAAGIEEGPAVGRGLEAALAAKLDGRASGREAELRVAIEAARAQPKP
jgi:tRNA nucleotidyltransferase (CCA-adding enzyme)